MILAHPLSPNAFMGQSVHCQYQYCQLEGTDDDDDDDDDDDNDLEAMEVEHLE